MGDDALTDFILKSRQRGRSDEQILRNLISVGWKKERIDSAFAALSAKKIQSPTGMPQKEGQEETVSTPEKEETAPEKKQPVPAAKDAQPEKAALPPAQVPIKASSPRQEKKPLFPFSFGKKAEPPPSQPAAAPPKAPEKVEPPQPASPPWSSVSLARNPSKQIAPPSIPRQQGAAAPNGGAPELQPSASGEKEAPGSAAQASSAASESSVKMPPVLRPLWPSEKEGAALPTPEYPRVENDAQVQNPAFSNLERATGAGGVMKFAPLIAVILILITGAAAYYFFVLHAASAPPLAGNGTNTSSPANHAIVPAANATQGAGANSSSSENQPSNGTSPPPPPVQQPANVSAPANNSTAVQQPPAQANTTTTQPAAQQPGPVQANASPAPPAAANNSTAQNFTRFRTYTESAGKLPSKYCASLGGAVIRIHYLEYYGIECSSEKGTSGYTNESGFLADKCRYLTSVPCCFDSGNSAYSYLYDSFECGFYS